MSKLIKFAAAGAAVLCALGAFAVEQVSPGSGDDAATITAAIAAAAGGDGVVQLAPGTYTLASTVTIDQSVTVKGVLASSTTITASGTGYSLFKLMNAGAVLERVTLTGATASTGAGVTVTAGTVQDAIITKNTATSASNAGAGVWLAGANSALRRCRVESNSTKSGYGGGVYHTGAVTIESCLITGNSASWGGGLYGENSAAVAVVSHCNIYSNSGPSGGADIYDYSQSTLNTYYYCYFGSAIVQKKSNTQTGCVVGGAISEDTLKGKANPITDQPKLANLDLNGAPFNPTKPSVGCVEYDVVDVEADFAPSGAAPGTTVLATVSYRNLPEGATVSTELFDVDGAVVGGSPTGGDFTFTTGVRPGDYTLVVTLKVGGVERQIRSTPFYCGYSTVHVSTTGSGTAPYDTEETGLTDIQTAIDSCVPGATVIVHDGTYELDEPVVLERAITVRSANGRAKTTLKPAIDKQIRLAYLNHAEALLDGFTLTSGRSSSTKYGNTPNGGGVLIDAKGGTVDNCIVEKCSSSGHGGQAAVCSARAIIRRTILRDSLEGQGYGAVYAGGSNGGLLDNCVISGNALSWGAGVYVEQGSCLSVVNCTIVDNRLLDTRADNGVVYAYDPGRCFCTNSILQKCGGSVTTVNSIGDSGRLFKDAANNDYSLLAEDTAAIDKGLALDGVLATDVYGRKRVSGDAIDIGAAEFQTEVLDVEFACNKKSGLFGTDASFVLTPTVTGASGPVTLTWLITCNHGRRTVLNAKKPDEPLVFEPETPGSFTVKLTADDGSGEPAVIEKPDFVVAGASEVYVDVEGSNAFPYLTPTTAAHDFDDAWALVVSGSVVHVAAGLYRPSKELSLKEPIQVLGAGRDVTTLRLKDGVNDRVATLNHRAALIHGCTLSGGRLGTPSNRHGCGVLFGVKGGIVEDCRITDNRLVDYVQNGGGVAFEKDSKGVVRRTIIDGNNVKIGNDSGYGGGIYTPGGGVVENCLIVSNTANWGGGFYLDGSIWATNCTVVGNSGSGAGVYGYNSGWKNSRFVNLILRPRAGLEISGQATTNGVNTMFSHCSIEAISQTSKGVICEFPEVNGNTHVVPEFVNAAAGDYHLKRKSPLRKAGLVTPGMKGQTDLDGRSRLSNGVVDIGCYQTPNGGLTLILR